MPALTFSAERPARMRRAGECGARARAVARPRLFGETPVMRKTRCVIWEENVLVMAEAGVWGPKDGEDIVLTVGDWGLR